MATASNDEGNGRSGAGHDVSTTSPHASPSPLPSKRPRELETSQTKAVLEKLEAIIIPVVSFERTTAEEAIDFLSLRVTELDPERSAGMSFRVKRPRIPDLPAGVHADISYISHDFEAENISAWRLLKRIASDNGMRVEVTEQEILLTSPEADRDPMEEGS
jgi:hypothetical protein